MIIDLEVGDNLRKMVEDFCFKCEDRYNLGSEVRDAFGLDFGNMIDQLIKSHLEGELKEIIIKVK